MISNQEFPKKHSFSLMNKGLKKEQGEGRLRIEMATWRVWDELPLSHSRSRLLYRIPTPTQIWIRLGSIFPISVNKKIQQSYYCPALSRINQQNTKQQATKFSLRKKSKNCFITKQQKSISKFKYQSTILKSSSKTIIT